MVTSGRLRRSPQWPGGHYQRTFSAFHHSWCIDSRCRQLKLLCKNERMTSFGNGGLETWAYRLMTRVTCGSL